MKHGKRIACAHISICLDRQKKLRGKRNGLMNENKPQLRQSKGEESEGIAREDG
jgi:hypothetical protein